MVDFVDSVHPLCTAIGDISRACTATVPCDAKHLLLLAPDGTAESAVEAALRAKSYACVVIGAGLREPPEHLLLFEKVLNLVHRLAPDAAIAFNSTPADTAEAVQRRLA